MDKSSFEQIKEEDMFLIQTFDGKRRLPFTISHISDIIKPYSTSNNINEENIAIYYKSVYIRPVDNLPLIDIGYSPMENIELKYIQRRIFYFLLPLTNYIYPVEFFSNETIFDAKCHFANEFTTVPQNIHIDYKGKKLSDETYLFDFHNSKKIPYQITLEKGYQLYYTFCDSFNFVCLKEKSTIQDLKNTISSKNMLYYGLIYGERIREYFNRKGKEKKDENSYTLEKLSNEIKIFDFDFLLDIKEKPISYDFSIAIDQNRVQIKKHIENIDSNSPIYLITCILEKEYKIDRSMFIPYDMKGNQVELTNKISNYETIKFQINKTLFVKIEEEIKELSYMTTINDIRRMYNFTKNQFGIIINKHFAVELNGKEYLTHFLKNNDKESCTEIILKKPITPCHIQTFTNINTNKTEHFIVPDFFNLEKTVNIYLKQNINSINITSQKQDLLTLNSHFCFQVAETRKIDIKFIDEEGHVEGLTIDVNGENPRIIDLLYCIDEKRKGFLWKKSSFYDASLVIDGKITKLHFMQYLSQISYSNENKIIVNSYSPKKKIYYVRNNIEGKLLEFPYKSISSKKIIENIVKKTQGKDFNIYLEYKQLNQDDYPLICNLEQNSLVFNETKEEKRIVISNGSFLKIPLTISKNQFTDVSEMIISKFNVTNLSELSFSYLAFGETFLLPLNFDVGSIPDDCEVVINYKYKKSDFVTFNNGKTAKIKLSNINSSIGEIKSEIQNKLKMFDMTPKSMIFSFFNEILNEEIAFTDYRINEDAIIKITNLNDSFTISVKMSENVVKEIIVSEEDTVLDIKNLIKLETSYDKKIKLINEDGQKLTNDQKLTRNMIISLSTDKVEIESHGLLGNNKYEINEILSINDTINYLRTKLNNNNISIFTFSKFKNCFVVANKKKRIFEFGTKLFVHQYFKADYAYFDKNRVPLNINENFEISECNTVKWFRNNILSKKILVSPEEISFYSLEGKIDESKTIGEVFIKNKNQIRFTFIDFVPEPEKVPQLTPAQTPKTSKFKPKVASVKDSLISTNFNLNYDGPNEAHQSTKTEDKNDIYVNNDVIIDLKNYTKFETIGKGGFGKVYKIKDNNKTDEFYAAKVLSKPISEYEKDDKNNLYRELNIMSKIDHPGIVKFIGFSLKNFENADQPVIITEYLENGTLKDVLKNTKSGLSPKKWDDTRKLISIYSIACAMSFLHSHDIIHRDLKPANILMDKEYYPKIADFGLSKIINKQESINDILSSGMKGTPIYMAPEVIKDQKYGKACDVYAFAMIVYEIITNVTPFEELKISLNEFYTKVQNGHRPVVDETIPEPYKNLISKCWKQEPNERPTFDQIMELLESDEFIQNDLVDKDEFIDFIEDLAQYQFGYNFNIFLIIE